MHRAHFIKPDGRNLWLYGRRPIWLADPDFVPTPAGQREAAAPHLRHHPIRDEWVIYAAHRQDRTFQPSAAENPLRPTTDRHRPTELPAGDYDVAVFDNRFPSLIPTAGRGPKVIGVETHPAIGRCEVVVFSQNPDLSLWQLPTDHIALILAVLAERSGTMAEAGMKYVLPFENRGAEMGVTLHHPHGQIYGYGFVPAIQARAAEQLRHHRGTHGHDLVSWLANQELRLQIRVVTQRNHALAFVPPFARFPREVWVVPLRARADLRSLTADERLDVAAVLGETLARLDGLWGKPMPYLLTFNQAPSDGEDHEEWTLRIEIWPLRRAADKLKYLAGTELGTGVFASDVLPEDAAADLRAVALPPSPDVVSRCS